MRIDSFVFFVRSRTLPLSVAFLVVVLVLGLPSGARAEPPVPAQWPTTGSGGPALGTTAHSVRIGGADRFETNFGAELVMRSCGDNDYPFDTADRTDSNAATLDGAHGWFGPGDCDFHAIIVAAGDRFADALAASAISDPGHQGDRTQLANVATGSIEAVETQDAPIILTRSARQGATGLSPTARAAAADAIATQTLVVAAIIVGGYEAVPFNAEADLQALGYQVYRVAGQDRFGTAGAIAMAVGTGAVSGATCADPVAADGRTDTEFYDRSSLEYRVDAFSCEVLEQTVLLADGVTGADALAAGWFASLFRVPILLTGPQGSMPEPTAAALATLAISNLVVLGGTVRIPDATVEQAAALAGVDLARVKRVAGTDRYDTSVAVAQRIGGFYATDGDPDDFDGDTVCLAASGGEGVGALGWPDALAAGPFCGYMSGEGDGDQVSPRRALLPTAGRNPRVVGGHDSPSHDVTPILLVRPGASALPDSVGALLTSAFAADSRWCTSEQALVSCAQPGFVVAFGGPVMIPDAALQSAATAVSGGTYVDFADQTPSLAAGFYTELAMPNHAVGGDSGANRVCFPRGALDDVRWLAVYDDDALREFDAQTDVMSLGFYGGGVSEPVCISFADDAVAQAPEDRVSTVVGSSVSGHFTAGQSFDYSLARRLTLSTLLTQHDADGSGIPGIVDVDAAGSTTWTWSDAVAGTTVTSKGETVAVTMSTITLTLTRGDDVPGFVAPDVVTGSFTLSTAAGALSGTIQAEGTFVGGQWLISGRSSFGGGTFPAAGTGGFSATVSPEFTPANNDDDISWSLDGLVN